jgi:hypothetical protein
VGARRQLLGGRWPRRAGRTTLNSILPLLPRRYALTGSRQLSKSEVDLLEQTTEITNGVAWMRVPRCRSQERCKIATA